MTLKVQVKCPFCAGEAILAKSNLCLFNGIITLKDGCVYDCTNCREKFATGEMIDKNLQKLKKVFGEKKNEYRNHWAHKAEMEQETV